MTGMPSEVAIASRNPGKIREIKQICADWPVAWVVADEDPREWPDVEETGRTYLENALLKAREVARVLDMPCVADDSGIEADALDGAPGPRSARFAGDDATDEDNLQLLIDSISGGSVRAARYVCVAVAAWPDGREIHAEATCEGPLLTERRGSGGFGYDPIFVPADDDTGRTMAELSAEEKDAISHRGRAFRALRAAMGGS